MNNGWLFQTSLNTYYPPILLRSYQKHTFMVKFTSSSSQHERDQAKGNGITLVEYFSHTVCFNCSIHAYPFLMYQTKISKVIFKMTHGQLKFDRVNKKDNYQHFTLLSCVKNLCGCISQAWVMRCTHCMTRLVPFLLYCFSIAFSTKLFKAGLVLIILDQVKEKPIEVAVIFKSLVQH